MKVRPFVYAFIAVNWLAMNAYAGMFQKGLLADVDTAYSRIWVYDFTASSTGQATRLLGINNESQSAMFLGSDALAYEYTKYYHLIKHFVPGFKNVLMLGGGGYSYPKDFLRQYPEATMDVVELDPGVTELAKRYFGLPENPRLTIYAQDGRVYLNTASRHYDAILGDAFGASCSVPYQLTTRETAQKSYALLNDNGVVIMNIISAIHGGQGAFLRAEYATYKSVFPYVYLFPVSDPPNGEKVQNIMLVALKSKQEPNFTDTDPIIDQYLHHVWKGVIEADMPILTDDFAPVDHYVGEICLKK